VGADSGRSNQVKESAKPPHGLGKPLAFKGGEQFLGCFGRVGEALALPLDRGADRAWREVEQVDEEVVGVLGLDAGYRTQAS
jgi:hypothetical protein